MKKIKIAIALNLLLVSGINAQENNNFSLNVEQSVSVQEFKKNTLVKGNNFNKIILKSEKGFDQSFEENLYNNYGIILKFDKKILDDFYVYFVNSSYSDDELRNIFEPMNNVDNFSFDVVIKTPQKKNLTNTINLDGTRNYDYSKDALGDPDPLRGNQLYLDQPTAVNLGLPDLDRAIDISSKNHKVRLGIVDTGSIQHEDVYIVEGYRFSRINDPDRGQNYTAYTEQEIYDKDDPELLIYSGNCYDDHGTKVAGIVSARTDNGLGIKGVVDTEIVMAKALEMDCQSFEASGYEKLGNYSVGYISDVVESLEWLSGETVDDAPDISEPVDIINLSLGGEVYTGCDLVLQTAIDDIVSKGIIVMAAAGNEDRDVRNIVPAGCNNLVVVGSNSLDGNKSTFSNYGNNIDVTSYGEYLTTLNPITANDVSPKDYSIGDDVLAEGSSGTSYSVAMATSTAGLMIQSYGNLITQDIFKDIIKKTAVRHPEDTSNPDIMCSFERCGNGILQSYDAMSYANSVFGYSTDTLNEFSGMNTCEEEDQLEALDYYLNVCGTYNLDITNNSELENSFYNIVRVNVSEEFEEDNLVIIKSTTTDNTDRSLSLTDIDLDTYKYGIQSCVNDTCYTPLNIVFDSDTLPNYCKN